MVTPDNNAHLAVAATKDCKADDDQELKHDDRGENDDSEEEAGEEAFIADLFEYRWDLTRPKCTVSHSKKANQFHLNIYIYMFA